MRRYTVEELRKLARSATATLAIAGDIGPVVPTGKTRYVYALKYNDASGAVNDVVLQQLKAAVPTDKDNQRIDANDTQFLRSEIEAPLFEFESGSTVHIAAPTGAVNITYSYYEL